MQAPNFISQTQYRNSCPRGPAHSMLRSLRLDRLTGKLTYKVLRELGHRQTRQTPIELRTFVTNEVRDLIEQDREGTRGYPSSAATRGRSSIGTRGIRSIIEKARRKFPEECGSPIQDDLFHSPNAGLHPPDVTTHDDPPSNSDATAAKNISRTRNGGSHSRISLPNLSQAALDRPRAATCSPTSFISDSGASEEGRYPVARIMRANRLVCDEPWSKKIDEDLQKLKQETALQRDQELEKRRQQRQLLDQQVTQRRQALIEEREAKRQYAREQERLNKLWEDEQHRIQEEKFRQERANKAQRESLLEAKRQQDREREQKEKIEGRAWALKLSEEAQQEEIARRNKKKEHAKLFREFIQENNRLADQRKQEALLEKQKEKEILKRFTKVLEEQEKKGALEKALASKRAQLVLMKQTSIAETMRKAEEQRRREEESHERHIEELLRRREAEEYEREMNRQQRREKARQEFVVALEDQLHEKEAQKQREVEEQQRLREQADEEVKAWHVWQREQQKKSKERKLQQLEALERQTHENEIKARCPIPIKVWENPLCRQGTAPSRNEPHSLGGASLNTSLVS